MHQKYFTPYEPKRLLFNPLVEYGQIPYKFATTQQGILAFKLCKIRANLAVREVDLIIAAMMKGAKSGS